MDIKCDLSIKQKRRGKVREGKITLYEYGAELLKELESIGIVHRLKEVPQLGMIKVTKNLLKTKYDYMTLQLYFHHLINNNLQSHLKFSYNNKIKYKDFNNAFTIGEILQVLVIAYNIGHFYNTFTSSCAVVMLAEENTKFLNLLMNNSSDPQYSKTIERLIEEQDYKRFHLLNSILILDRCDTNKSSVKLAKYILYAYLNQHNLPKESKLHFVFNLFRNVRDVSYIAYDLKIASTPLMFDINNEKAMSLLFKELLSVYNDHLPAKQMIISIQKMLDDTVYNENSLAISHYRTTRKIVSLLKNQEMSENFDYYESLFLKKDSVLNSKYSQTKDFSSEAILKLTFKGTDSSISKELLLKLERINNSRIGYYDRYSGERTILVSIRRRCNDKSKTAFRILKLVISYLRKISDIVIEDSRFLLVTKFFLHYLFQEKPIIIKSTIDQEICVLCTRGSKSRAKAIDLLLKNGLGTKDERHEVEFMVALLSCDDLNDTTITIPGSILVYKEASKLCEFDGMIIHPMRKKEQIIFLESKNTKLKPNSAKNCLGKKFDKLQIVYDNQKMETVGFDCNYKFSI